MSFAELSAFMNERDDRAEAKAEKARQEAKAEKAEMAARMEEMEAKLEQQRQETEQQRQQNAKLREQALLVAALQSRVQALHAARLLGDEELHRLEDIIVDGCDIDGGGGETGESRLVAQMVALSGRVVADGAFARQLRRKFV